MRNARKRGERAADELVRALEQARDEAVKRLEGIDFDAVRKRSVRVADTVQSGLERRVRLPRGLEQRIRPRPRRRLRPMAGGATGLLLAGMAGAGLARLLADPGRREQLRRGMDGFRVWARERYAVLAGGRAPRDADLEERVRSTIAAQGPTPEGLEVSVEGRTVYLRGAVPDPAFVDEMAERVHNVEGVVAVVNLTTAASAS
ncbi:MAG TPA: BON domain-containing protein [Candidatus Dormibacteraeota bacterium]|nr:BON domain-containing protein [Candidatus Dormibacteraeota bacterium]